MLNVVPLSPSPHGPVRSVRGGASPWHILVVAVVGVLGAVAASCGDGGPSSVADVGLDAADVTDTADTGADANADTDPDAEQPPSCDPATCDGVCVEGVCEPDVVSCDPATCDGLCVEGVCEPAGPRDCVLGVDVDTVAAAFADSDCLQLIVPPGTFSVVDVNATRLMPIVGAGTALSTLDAGGAGRHFTVPVAGVLSLTSVALVNGVADGGGSIFANTGATLLLDDVRFDGNRATSMGGAIQLLSGTLTGTDCAFEDNQVVNTSGTGGARGGAIAASASTLTFEDCSFDRNRVTVDLATNNLGVVGEGGAIAVWQTSSLTLERTGVFDNEVRSIGAGAAVRRGGAIWADASAVVLDDVTVQGNGLPAATGCSTCSQIDGGALYQTAGGRLDIVDSRFIVNIAEGPASGTGGLVRGGAISTASVPDITVRRTEFRGNIAANGANRIGGAIFILQQTFVLDALFEDVRFDGNSAECLDDDCRSSDAAGGGAVYLQAAGRTCRLTFDRVTGVENSVDAPSTGTAGGFLHVLSLNDLSFTEVVLRNTTLLANRSSSAASAINLNGAGPVSGPGAISAALYNTTIADGSGSSVIRLSQTSDLEEDPVRLTTRNTIIANPTTSICSISGAAPFVSEGWTVHPGSSACGVVAGTGDLVSTTPGLLAAVREGLTSTLPLAADSVARTTGEPGGCTAAGVPLTVDQRGEPRTTATCTPGAWSP